MKTAHTLAVKHKEAMRELKYQFSFSYLAFTVLEVSVWAAGGEKDQQLSKLIQVSDLVCYITSVRGKICQLVQSWHKE